MWETIASSIGRGSLLPSSRSPRNSTRRSRRNGKTWSGPPSTSSSFGSSFVPKWMSRASPKRARMASRMNMAAPFLSHRLQGPQHVEHSCALEVALASEIGGGRAEDLFDPLGAAEELVVARDEER